MSHVAAVEAPSRSGGEGLLGYLCILLVAEASTGIKRVGGGWEKGLKIQ